LEPLLPYFLHQ
jgi:hypothetical protein